MKDSLLAVARAIFDLARHRDVSFLAGAIAFFAFVSLVPAMVLVLAVGAFVGGEQFAERVVALVGSYLSEEGSGILTEALVDSPGLAGVSAVSGLFLFWSALKVFRAIDIAFDRVYQARSATSLPEQLRNGTVVLLAIGAGLGTLLAVQMLLARFTVFTTFGLLSLPLAVSGLVLVLFPLYYVLTPVRQSVRSILPGIFVAVIGLVLLQQLFRVYAAGAGQYRAYGFVGAVLLFLLWLYFGALILVFGAVVNAAIADMTDEGHEGSKQSTAETTD